MTDDPRDILKTAGVECAELDLAGGGRVNDEVDCTCRTSSHVRYNEGLKRLPCPVHGLVFATKNDRIELLEERVSELERRWQEHNA